MRSRTHSDRYQELMTAASDEPAICPSGRAVPGAVLLGVVQTDGRVGYITPRMEVDEDWLAIARTGRDLEKRYRFATPCARTECEHWRGRCSVGDAALDLTNRAASDQLPRCSVRRTCVWYAQSGRAACTACPRVITDVSEARTP
jgi:hypothetical protein